MWDILATGSSEESSRRSIRQLTGPQERGCGRSQVLSAVWAPEPFTGQSCPLQRRWCGKIPGSRGLAVPNGSKRPSPPCLGSRALLPEQPRGLGRGLPLPPSPLLWLCCGHCPRAGPAWKGPGMLREARRGAGRGEAGPARSPLLVPSAGSTYASGSDLF